MVLRLRSVKTRASNNRMQDTSAKAITPILTVSDMQQSFAWFEKLGWEKGWD
jgi:hypothetical protein